MQFALSHRHPARECGIAYAAWRGFDSPLRHAPTLASCGNEAVETQSDHLLLWTVDAASEEAALALLPGWLADRTEVRRVAEVPIP
jgi:hypothetical protein